MSVPALDIRDLCVSLDTPAGSRRVVDHISFSVEVGECRGLVGESGCGKTLMALSIMGLLTRPGVSFTAAGIKLLGREISTISPRQRRAVLGRDIAMIFQQPGTALDPVFTVGRQIMANFRRHSGAGGRRAYQAALEALDHAGFDNPRDIAHAYPHQLSGGMQQLVMIAMAMMCKPAVLIADEPTTALDNHSQALVLRQLERLRSEHDTAILLISHDMSVVRQSCRDVMVMYCGRILEMTDIETLHLRPGHPYSAGLLSCIPKIESTRPNVICAIPGQVPATTSMPPGCHFEPRCKRAIGQCRESVPVLDRVEGRLVACFRPL